MRQASKIFAIIFFTGIIMLHSCRSASSGAESSADTAEVNSEVDASHKIIAPPDSLNLDDFYKKYLNASGIPIISSDKVPDEALFAVRTTVNEMMSMRKDLLAKMIGNKLRVGIIAKSEVTKDMPEYRTLEEDNSGRHWNDDRGIGATM